MYKYKLTKYQQKYKNGQCGGKQPGCHPLSTSDCGKNKRGRCARVEDGQGSDGKCICNPSTRICVSTTSEQGLRAVNQRLFQDLQQLQETLKKERAGKSLDTKS